ncbi:MAG: family 10 glycosylhydrolase [Cyanobacteria bacterium P01_A01_bin.114]
MDRLSIIIKQRKPGTIFSVSPNPYDYAYRGQLQDWLTWVREGLVDELIVQVYRDSLSAFRAQLARPEIQEARRLIPTGAGVLTGLRNSPVPISFIQAKVQSARAYGLGVSFFFYESLWESAPEPVEERQAGFQALFPERSARVGGTAVSQQQLIDPEG